MKLTNDGVWINNQKWKDAGVNLPQFDYDKVKQNTLSNPTWVHFGGGNIFRAFPCALQQQLLNDNKADSGIIVASSKSSIETAYRPFDNNGVLVTLKVDGDIDTTVISSVLEALVFDQEEKEDFDRLIDIFTNHSLQMISFTITEKGYNIHDASGEFTDEIKADISKDIKYANSFMGKLVLLLHHRYASGELPLALVSMDNVSHNGDKLKEAVLSLAKEWEKQGSVDHLFIAYLEHPEKISFPWSMIDKITPRPDENIMKTLIDMGFKDAQPVITPRGTYIAPFVNAEESQYLVIEDHFPNGHPSLEEVGVIFTDRETVDKVETMKVTTCLNPLHTTLAVFGCILGYERIYEEMQDELLVSLISQIGYDEGLPVVVNPGIIDPKEFIDEVLNVRFPNPFMPDTPQRIATDTSQKISIRFLETIRKYYESDTLEVSQLKLIPLVIAGWIRYLMGINDAGEQFELSPDPLMDTLLPHVKNIEFGMSDEVRENVKAILNNERVFSLDLYEVGLGTLIEDYFIEMIAGVGAVRKTLEKYV